MMLLPTLLDNQLGVKYCDSGAENAEILSDNFQELTRDKKAGETRHICISCIGTCIKR